MTSANTLQSRVVPRRRGVCPGVAKPMLTGDGLLARLTPSAPIPIDAFIALCTASQRYGNGVVEITQRGSLQIRGLTELSAPAFAIAAEEFAAGTDDRPQLLQPPLSGLAADEALDVRELIAQARSQLAQRPYLQSLGPKVSVLIDGGGKLHLDSIAADVRIRAAAQGLHVSIAGTASTARNIGWIAQGQAVACIDELLALIAARGSAARAQDLSDDINVLLADRVRQGAPPQAREAAEPLGHHALRNGQWALGIALTFGYAHTDELAKLAGVAASLGVTSVQPSSGRALLWIGLMQAAADELAVAARESGMIVDPQDPRRYVVACAGAPACASATLPTRDLAPSIARIAQPWLNRSTMVHLSGCIKGCAHPDEAMLTVAGPDHLIINGRAGDAPHAAISSPQLITGFERLTAVVNNEGSLSMLNSTRITECFMGVNGSG